ncbi:hypothetical protein R1sor_006227 [Riccia sorocarpa]|uniref:VQ domain-containing protein n=1 Tax=Riccia sorocarpa TaxID=122646 RepID=A0ABD3HR20_9MARC
MDSAEPGSVEGRPYPNCTRVKRIPASNRRKGFRNKQSVCSTDRCVHFSVDWRQAAHTVVEAGTAKFFSSACMLSLQMAAAVDGKVEHGNTETIVRALRRTLRQHRGGSGGSPSSSQISASRNGVLEKLQAVSEAKLTNGDVRKGRSLQSGSSSDSGGCGELPIENGLATSKYTMPQPPPSAARITKALSVPTSAAVAAIKKPKRKRKSKKTPTTVLHIETEKFLQTVRELTGGTYGCQSDMTATPLVSQPSATRNALEPARPQPSRPVVEVTPTNPPAAVPVVAAIPPIDLEPASDLLGLLFQSSEGSCSLLSETMGYGNQNSWNVMASTFSPPERVDGYGSKSSQFAGVYSTEVAEGSSATFSFSLAEQLERRQTPSAMESLKHAGSHPFEDVEAWFL